MPTSHPISKEILQALEHSIIPALWQEGVPLGYVEAPLEFPLGIDARLTRKTLPRAEREDVDFPFQTRWRKANLHSTFYPYLGFIYEGIADEHTLITAAQSAKFHLAKGVYAIRWQAPGVLLFPSGVAHNGGGSTFWEDKGTPPPRKILWIILSPELLIHTHIEDGAGQRYVSHSLQIKGSAILSLAALFMEELQNARLREQGSAQALLLSMMLRLQKNLRMGRAKIANTSRSPIPTPGALPPDDRVETICRDIAIFIQMHLHEPLTLPAIAKEAGFSPAHLNRLFQRIYGVSVMRYTRLQRINAAQKILEVGNENITEIAQLMGFKRANLFSRAFHQETGLSPAQFRRQAVRNNLPKTAK